MRTLLRIIDANLNRSREGLRVCEDIARFVLNEKSLTRSFKSVRHRISTLANTINKSSNAPLSLLKSRNIKRDVGKKNLFRESKRKDIFDIFYANLQRAKEATRVLEETAKLIDNKLSQNFKKVRFRIYEAEKK